MTYAEVTQFGNSGQIHFLDSAEMSYATFVRFRNGLIANYREYWNPIAFTAAMAGTRFDDSAK